MWFSLTVIDVTVIKNVTMTMLLYLLWDHPLPAISPENWNDDENDDGDESNEWHWLRCEFSEGNASLH